MWVEEYKTKTDMFYKHVVKYDGNVQIFPGSWKTLLRGEKNYIVSN